MNSARRVLLALACAFSLSTIGVPKAVAAPDPLTCTGYPEPRVFIEAQQWWMPPGTEDFGHVHMGMCFPRYTLPNGSPNKVSGTVHFDFIVQLHNNPGTLQFVRIHLYDGNGQNHQAVRVNVGETAAQHCPATPDQCTWDIPVNLDTRVSSTDGYANIRTAAIVTHPNHGGTKRFAGGAWSMYLNNGKPIKNYQNNAPVRVGGSSWYTGALYEEAELISSLPYTVSGTWSPTVTMRPGAGGVDVTGSFASIDPAFHATPPNQGQVILNQSGPFKGQISIDTTNLSNGPHKLFLRAAAPCNGTPGNDCGKKPDGTTNNVATSYSVQVVTFFVQN